MFRSSASTKIDTVRPLVNERGVVDGIRIQFGVSSLDARIVSEMELEFLPCQKSFKRNPLLVHPVVGRARRPTSKLPPKTFVYGSKSDRKTSNDAGEIIFHWKQHVPNPLAKPGLDFVRLNVASVDEGALTSQQVSNYRSAHEIRMRKGFRQSVSTDMPSHLKGMAFGKGTKSSEREDFKNIITNQAHKVWIEEQRKRAQERNKMIRSRYTGTGVIPRSTRADALRQAQRQTKETIIKQKSEASLWKMERFRNVQSRVSIARSETPQL